MPVGPPWPITISGGSSPAAAAAKSRVGRRVVEGVRGAAVRAGVADALRDRQVADLGQLLDRAAPAPSRCAAWPGRCAPVPARWSARRPAARPCRRPRAVRGFPGRAWRWRAARRCRVQARQLADAVLDIGADDFARSSGSRTCCCRRSSAGRRIRPRAGTPGARRRRRRSGTGSTSRCGRTRSTARRPATIRAGRSIRASPPATRRPLPRRAVGGDVGQPQLGALPRHARMVPAQPGELPAVGRQARRRSKNRCRRPARSGCRRRRARTGY